VGAERQVESIQVERIMDETFDLWQLLAGLGSFLFGMYLLEDSVKALSGRALRRMISH